MRVVARETEILARVVVDSALKVHRALGPGLLESVYELCLRRELAMRGVRHRTQVVLPVRYEGLVLNAGLRQDMLVDEDLVVEIKVVERVLPLHLAQLLTYLKMADRPLGLLLNFNVPLIRDGIHRVILPCRQPSPP